jgi:hypothetical protein
MTGCNVRASKSGSGSVLYSGLVEVGPVSAPRWTWFLTLGDRVSAGVVLFLAGVALMAGLVAVFWYQCWPVTARKADQ